MSFKIGNSRAYLNASGKKLTRSRKYGKEKDNGRVRRRESSRALVMGVTGLGQEGISLSSGGGKERIGAKTGLSCPWVW